MNVRHAAPLGATVFGGLFWVAVTAAPALAQPKEEPADTEAPAAETAPAAPADTTSTEPAAEEEKKDSEAADTETSAPAKAETKASAEVAAKPAAKPVEAKADASVVAPPAPPAEEKPAEASQISLASFEVLPPGAYPEPRVRGIPGGSLRLDMQGLQWPYLPKQAGGPATRIGFSGSVWVDTAWRRGETELPSKAVVTRWVQQGRGVLRLSPTYNWDNDWFVQAQGEAVLNSDQTVGQPTQADADDLWVRFGKWNLFDVQLGRYQAWEVYHLGMGLDLNTFERRGAETASFDSVQLYNVNIAWDRPSGAGNIAAHIYPLDILRIEVLGQLGNISSLNSLSARPAAILDLGFIKARAAYEYQVQTATAQKGDNFKIIQKGAGGSLQAVFDPWVEFGVNYGRRIIDAWNPQGGENVEGSTTTDSLGGFANGQPIEDIVIGAGVNWTRWNNLQVSTINPGHYEEKGHLQAYGAAQYLLFKSLYIKGVGAYSKAHFDASSTARNTSEGLSGRLRLMYLF